MLLKQRLGYVLFGVGLAIVLGALLRPMSPIFGWALLSGFGLVSMPYLAAMLAMPSQQASVSFGVYILLAGVALGLPRIWSSEPDWLRTLVTVAFVGAVVWMCVELVRTRRRQRAST